ncbi:expressed unknown protein [Seminavis robusta]|uniref:Uncharacterized protein n=1 Tax=Seminavis robusta TaxID=568900 RepID=A0A9N8DB91_9STRA|nr:expressed unknown protein [Seminavis robusta]|eukprot:Sro22_g015221.1  (188) ;mRNA; r:46029-46592
MTAKRRNEDGSITQHPIYHPGLSAFCHECFEPGVAQSNASKANSFKVRKLGPSMYNHARAPGEDGLVGGGRSARKDICERRYDNIAQNVAEEIAAEVEAQRRQREREEAVMAEASTYTYLGLDPNNPEHRTHVESLRALGSAVPASAPAPAAAAAPAASAESTSEDDEGSVSRRVKRAKRGKKKGSY